MYPVTEHQRIRELLDVAAGRMRLSNGGYGDLEFGIIPHDVYAKLQHENWRERATAVDELHKAVSEINGLDRRRVDLQVARPLLRFISVLQPTIAATPAAGHT